MAGESTFFNGAIDGFAASGGQFVLSGWGFFALPSGKVKPGSFSFDGDGIVSVVTMDRPDIGSGDQFGFRVTLRNAAGLTHLLTGAASLRARYQELVAPVSLWKGVRGKILASVVAEQMAEMSDGDVSTVVSAVLSESRRNAADVPSELSEAMLGVGMLAYDKAVIVGRQGHLFLHGGANHVQKLYEQPSNERLVSAWEKLVASRSDGFKRREITFIQTIIPEKQSILSDLYPVSITGPTGHYLELAKRVNSCAEFLDARRVLSDLYMEGIHPFRKVDSHLSFPGALSITLAMVHRLTGQSVSIEPPLMVTQNRGGDLGNKFGFGDLVEACPTPEYDSWEFSCLAPVLKLSFDPAAGHNGAMREWEGVAPIHPGRLLIFGNSMFERGASAFGLSWWMARIFGRTRFVWSPRVDWQLVDEWAPDYVICQTVERFLPSVPVDA